MRFSRQQAVIFVGTTFYAGFISSKAPGTVGALLASLIYWIVGMMAGWSLGWHLAAIGTSFAASVWAGNHARGAFRGQVDPSQFTMDEVCGQWVSLLPLTVYQNTHWLWVAIGFGLFRLFDIAKPFPVGYLDRKLKGGLGITMDDVAAGIYAGGILVILKATVSL
jgi:phosphatidylglycerophosphatase A